MVGCEGKRYSLGKDKSIYGKLTNKNKANYDYSTYTQNTEINKI
jgi:hypothetical protein